MCNGFRWWIVLYVCFLNTAACATAVPASGRHPAPDIRLDHFVAAKPIPEPPVPLKIVEVPEPLPAPAPRRVNTATPRRTRSAS